MIGLACLVACILGAVWFFSLKTGPVKKTAGSETGPLTSPSGVGLTRHQETAQPISPTQSSTPDPSRPDLGAMSKTEPTLPKPEQAVPSAGVAAQQTPSPPVETAASKPDEETKKQTGPGMMEVSAEGLREMKDGRSSHGGQVFSVQVGGFLLEDNANRFCQKLIGLGYDARIVPTPISDGRVMNRVLVGRFSSQARAAEELAALRAKEKVDGYITTHTR